MQRTLTCIKGERERKKKKRKKEKRKKKKKRERVKEREKRERKRKRKKKKRKKRRKKKREKKKEDTARNSVCQLWTTRRHAFMTIGQVRDRLDYSDHDWRCQSLLSGWEEQGTPAFARFAHPVAGLRMLTNCQCYAILCYAILCYTMI